MSSVLKKIECSPSAGGMAKARRWQCSTSMTVKHGRFKTFPMAYGASVSIHQIRDGRETAQQHLTCSMQLESAASLFSRTEWWFLRRRSRIDGTLYLYSWSF